MAKPHQLAETSNLFGLTFAITPNLLQVLSSLRASLLNRANYFVAFSRCTPSFISLPRLGATYSPASVISILTISLFEHIFYANHDNHPNRTCLKPNYSFFILPASFLAAPKVAIFLACRKTKNALIYRYIQKQEPYTRRELASYFPSLFLLKK